MLVRVTSGLIGIIVFIGLCFSGLLPFTIMVIVLAAGAAAELARAEMVAPAPAGIPKWALGPASLFRNINPLLTCLSVAQIPLAIALVRRQNVAILEAYAGILAICVVLGVASVVRASRTGVILGWFRAFYGKIGFWYVGLFSSLMLIRSIPGRMRVGGFAPADSGAWLVLWAAICIWSTDTVAYLVGKQFGRHKLAPKLSPGKTVEGFLGGLLGAIAAGAVVGNWIGFGFIIGSSLGAIAGIFGPLGDLFASGLKREIGIKDFGAVMPGHGGILDRFDSFLFVAPMAYLLLIIVTNR